MTYSSRFLKHSDVGNATTNSSAVPAEQSVYMVTGFLSRTAYVLQV